MKRSTEKGFTLVELIVVITIIGVLSAILIPTFVGVLKSSKSEADKIEFSIMKTELIMAHSNYKRGTEQTVDGFLLELKKASSIAESKIIASIATQATAENILTKLEAEIVDEIKLVVVLIDKNIGFLYKGTNGHYVSAIINDLDSSIAFKIEK